MLRIFRNFLLGISVNWAGKIGVILTTSAFFSFLILQAGMFMGLITNAYVGLIVYLAFPALFIIGLILIPIGWYYYRKYTGKSTRELLSERFDSEIIKKRAFGSKVVQTIGILTIVNVAFLGIASMNMLHFMDDAHFCGTACHSVMNPEWATYQQSPHAHVNCVECHVGEGTKALIDSKLNGSYQMLSLALNLYEQPIPTPVRQLRPARETCEKCHWPDKFYGLRLKTLARYQHDEESTPKYTTLGLKIDAGRGGLKKGIHWHIAEDNEVRYASVDDEREEMIWVEVRQQYGDFKRFENRTIDNSLSMAAKVRVFDCVDCHNRATHIYENPEKAVNDRIYRGILPEDLPYISREALTAISSNYATQEAGLAAIAEHLSRFYRDNYPEVFGSIAAKVDSAVIAAQEIYSRNIHPYMKISWGSYPNHIGHEGQDAGCFRCHNNKLIDKEGHAIKYDCTLCHSILAYDSPGPFTNLQAIDTTLADSKMQAFLQDEFFENYRK